MPSAPARPVVGLVVVLSLASACASIQKNYYTADEALLQVRARVSAEMQDKIVIPFEIDDEIERLAEDITRGAASDLAKTEAIVKAITGATQFSISYNFLSNKTAREVFRQGRGNCLAYANLFVGMARHVGLDAVYVDVVTVETTTQEAEVIVNTGHVTAGVEQGGAGVVIVDFTRTPETKYVGFKVIDDLEAIANYYNNQGFLYGYFSESEGRKLDFDPMEAEMEMIQLALQVKPSFGRARNNLGVALRRRGRIPEAIEQYQKAIEVAPDFAEAHANLGGAYYAAGRLDDALRELRIAVNLSGSNGYFHHQVGVVQYNLGRYEEAIKAFRSALSKEPGMAIARYLLGESYLKLGDKERALAEYIAALDLDPNFGAARVKVDLLTAQDVNRK
jgi:tetratricopeptide (TPR) repeat protein